MTDHEVRVDPLTGRRRSSRRERATRPGGGLDVEPAPPLDPGTDPFLEGHEDRTPPEVSRVRPDGGAPDTPGWTVRVVPNLYPALTPRRATPSADASPTCSPRRRRAARTR